MCVHLYELTYVRVHAHLSVPLGPALVPPLILVLVPIVLVLVILHVPPIHVHLKKHVNHHIQGI